MSALKSAIQVKAKELGFIACGFASAAPSQTTDKLEQWLSNGFQAGMDWMKRPDAVEKRADVQKLFPNAKTIIVVAMNYRTDAPYDETEMGGIARYARGLDYHDTIKERLKILLAHIQESVDCTGKICVDSSPILEREWAQRSGIGWIGKNTLIMSRDFGSYVLLAELLLDIEIEPDEPHIAQYCGNCTRCLDACPTDAFVAPRVLDANKCISYHTIENKKLASTDLRAKFGDWVFGCDICQQICPWNQKAERNGVYSTEPELWTRDEMPTLEEWPVLPQEEFSRRLKGSPIKRTKKRGMRRNAVRVLKNRQEKPQKIDSGVEKNLNGD
jgi:epoxyqueuosine reductase